MEMLEMGSSDDSSNILGDDDESMEDEMGEDEQNEDSWERKYGEPRVEELD
jgi:DNA-binding ferritin-like protein (Dps family)